jgi:arylsulfatase A-like enzyme
MQRPEKGQVTPVSPLLKNEQIAELLTDEQQSGIVARYTTEAVRFIEENREKPFFLYFPHTAVHTPIHPGTDFRGKSQNGRFGDWVQEVDWSVGQVLAALEKNRLAENTLVLFTSDNGPWLTKGSDGGSAGPLRGGKGSTWEGGMRVPTIAWWPGKIPAGTRCDTVMGTIDLLPTAVALAGGTLPATPKIDGRDISPLLFGKTTEAPREAHYYFSGYTIQAVRQGPWKLALTPQPENLGQKQAGSKQPRLYHLDQEIGEKTDLSEQHPEIVARLQKLAVEMTSEIGGTDPTARRPAGHVENPATLYPTDPRPAHKPKRKN